MRPLAPYDADTLLLTAARVEHNSDTRWRKQSSRRPRRNLSPAPKPLLAPKLPLAPTFPRAPKPLQAATPSPTPTPLPTPTTSAGTVYPCPCRARMTSPLFPATAFETIVDGRPVLIGNRKLMRDYGIDIGALAGRGRA